MNILYKDYSTFGGFSLQILVITIVGIILCAIPMYMIGVLEGILFMVFPITFFVWGNIKQTKESGF